MIEDLLKHFPRYEDRRVIFDWYRSHLIEIRLTITEDMERQRMMNLSEEDANQIRERNLAGKAAQFFLENKLFSYEKHEGEFVPGTTIHEYRVLVLK